MNDLTPDELAALNPVCSEIRQSRWKAFWHAHDRDAFYFVVGWAAGIVTVVAAADAWLYALS